MAEQSGPIAVIDDGGHLTVDAKEHLENGQLTLRFHRETSQAVEFLSQAIRNSSELRIVSMAPIHGDNTEVVLDLTTPDRAANLLNQLELAFASREVRIAFSLLARALPIKGAARRCVKSRIGPRHYHGAHGDGGHPEGYGLPGLASL